MIIQSGDLTEIKKKNRKKDYRGEQKGGNGRLEEADLRKLRHGDTASVEECT